jgi:hypothetical protein
MSDQVLLLQTLDRAVRALVQVDVVANRDGSWPERMTVVRQLQLAKELRTILDWVRTVRDLVGAYNMLAEQPADESTSEPGTPLM